MKVRHAQRSGDKIELQMTPMIDIVFQLLIFFIMTFKIVAPEGDFNIRMPIAAPSEGKLDELLIPPIKVRLTATSSGHLADIRMNEKALGRNFKALNMEIRQIVGDSSGPGRADDVEVEIDADYGLRFEHVMDAITQVSGYVGENNQIFKICEKIKFAPPRKPQ
ncbi:MAG: biopolymer transporter ExbD [Patescibacteria group bacterium]|nr:biopolymer transporter ExbD [Patescibacteria group bacterium]